MTLLVQFNSFMYSLTSDQNKTLLRIMIHVKAVMPFWGGGGGGQKGHRPSGWKGSIHVWKLFNHEGWSVRAECDTLY